MAGLDHKGAARLTPQSAGARAVFVADASATQIMPLDPSKAHDLFLHVAGNTNIVVQATTDSLDAVADGSAVFTANKTYAATSANGYMGSTKVGVTAVKITHSKQGGVADDANKVKAIGGRARVTARPIQTGAAAGSTGLGDYTALTSS